MQRKPVLKKRIKIKIKNILKSGAEKRVQQLRVLAALAEPGFDSQKLTAVYNSSPRGSNVLFWSTQAPGIQVKHANKEINKLKI